MSRRQRWTSYEPWPNGPHPALETLEPGTILNEPQLAALEALAEREDWGPYTAKVLAGLSGPDALTELAFEYRLGLHGKEPANA